MRLFRLFMVVLLSTAIPVQGVAGLTSVKAPCPMHAHQEATQLPLAELATVSADSHGSSHDTHGCCKDGACLKTGKTCKSCQVCKIGSQAQMTSQGCGTFAKPCDNQTPRYQSLVLGVTLASIWRPPTLL
jgi:hypothetical protein